MTDPPQGNLPPRLDLSILFRDLRPRSKASLDMAMMAAHRGNIGGVLVVQFTNGKPAEVVFSTANLPALKDLFKFD